MAKKTLKRKRVPDPLAPAQRSALDKAAAGAAPWTQQVGLAEMTRLPPAIRPYKLAETRPGIRWRAAVHARATVYATPIELERVSWFAAREAALCMFAEQGVFLGLDDIVVRPVTAIQ